MKTTLGYKISMGICILAGLYIIGQIVRAYL